jgi:hypothetical protein
VLVADVDVFGVLAFGGDVGGRHTAPRAIQPQIGVHGYGEVGRNSSTRSTAALLNGMSGFSRQNLSM